MVDVFHVVNGVIFIAFGMALIWIIIIIFGGLKETYEERLEREQFG